MKQKIWIKPALEVVTIRNAKGGTFHTSDSKMTHRSV